ncbi:MAG: carbohydrate ABC transporter permease, partial [Clostridia bacterium]
AYAITRKLPGKKFFYMLLLIPMFFSGGLIPSYLLMVSLGLKNSYAALILPAGVSTYYLMIMTSFFRELPPSLEESARLDGAGEFRILWSVYLPLCKSVLATISLFIIVGFWNEWFAALIYIDQPIRWPLQLHLRRIINAAESTMNDRENALVKQKVYAEGVRMASVAVTMLPIMCVYPFLQKYFAKGVMIGAVKG